MNSALEFSAVGVVDGFSNNRNIAGNPALSPPTNLANYNNVNNENVIEVLLVGGPDSIPRNLMVSNVLAANDKLKICYLEGYEHFERSTPGNTFTWTMRTKMAF